MTLWAKLAGGGALWLFPTIGAADEPAPRSLEIGLALGYAAPVGEAERGASLRDTSFGLAALALDAGYRLAPHIAVAGRFAYGLSAPTLCQTASDCEASLGTDVLVTFGARVEWPRLHSLQPLTELGVGYEWFGSRLSDRGAQAGRSYQGPVALQALLAAPFRLGAGWTLGPFVAFTFGTFTDHGLETNLGSSSGPIPERAIHVWTTIGVRIADRPF